MTIHVTVDADCSIEGFIAKSDFFVHDSADIALLEDCNDHVFRASEQRPLRFTLSADFTEPTIEDIALTVDEVEEVAP